MKKLIVLGLAIVLPMQLRAQDLDAQIEQLQKAGEDFASASAIGSGSPALRGLAEEYQVFSGNFGSLKSSVQENNYDQAIRTLDRWLKRTKNEQIKTALEGLLKGIRAEQATRMAKLTEQVNTLLKSAAQKLGKATTPEAVFLVQEELELFRDEELNNGSRSTRILSERVSRALNFTNSWLQIVTAETNGEYSQALQSLNSLRQNPSASALFTQPELAAKYQTLLDLVLKKDEPDKGNSLIAQVIATTMRKVKSPADAAAALTVMSELTGLSYGNDNRLANNVQNNLQQLVELNEDYQSGTYSRIIGSYSRASGISPYNRQIDALKNELRLQAIAAANDLPNLGSPAESEGLATFLRRLAGEAFAKKEWDQLFTLLSVYSNVTGGGCARTTDMKQGVAAFLSAKQLEESQQFGDAVSQYTRCAAQLGKLVPRVEANEALARLRKDHPEAFKPTGNLNLAD